MSHFNYLQDRLQTQEQIWQGIAKGTQTEQIANPMAQQPSLGEIHRERVEHLNN
jgi:FixJ family two-component response regulator